MNSRTARRPGRPAAAGAVPVVGGREPCPCGSGRRYKACHGRGAGVTVNPRPFAGRVDECDLVALREIVPSATAPLVLADGSGREVLLGTVLPLARPAMVRLDGSRMVGLRAAARSPDPDRDLGQALEAVLDEALDTVPDTVLDTVPDGVPDIVLDTAPDTVLDTVPDGVSGSGGGRGLDDLPAPLPGAGLVSLLDPAPLDITVHDGFDWWLAGLEGPSEEARAGLEEANAGVVPTSRLESVSAAYWCRIGDRTHLRWALPDPEDALLDAFARLQAAGALTVGAGSRYVGAFRALGIVVPVWNLAPDTEAGVVEEPALDLRARLDEALAATSPLSSSERRARAGVVSRNLTLR